MIPWSPLARGKLTRPWETQTHRSENDLFGQQLYKAMEANDRAIVERVRDVAEARGVSMAQVALAWLLQKPGITSPIIGATKPEQLTDAIAALALSLSREGECTGSSLPAPPGGRGLRAPGSGWEG